MSLHEACHHETPHLQSEKIQLVQAWKGLGWTQVTVQGCLTREGLPKLMALASQEGVTMTTLPAGLVKNPSIPVTTIVNSRNIDLSSLLSAVRIPYTTMLVLNVLDRHTEKRLEVVNKSVGFLLISRKSMCASKLLLYQTQTFRRKSGLVKNLWMRSQTTPFYKEIFDQHGSRFSNLELTFAPHVVVESCDKGHKACKVSGFFLDVMVALANLLNCTFTIDTEPDGNWGAVLLSGSWTRLHATFSGIFSAIVHDDYDVSFGTWFVRQVRSLWVDYTSPAFPYKISLFKRTDLPLPDRLFFLRPFTGLSWMSIIGTVCIIFATKRGAALLDAQGHVTLRCGSADKWLNATCGVYFLFLQAIFSGALITFFSSVPKNPFDMVELVASLYPAWNMILFEADKVLVLAPAESGSKPFQTNRKMYQEGTEKIFYPKQKVLEQLTHPGYFLFGSHTVLRKDF